MKIAFINNCFPSLSETFIYKEILELEKRKISLRTFSVRKPEIINLSKDSHSLYYKTTYLIPVNIYKFIWAIFYYIIKKPFLLVYLMAYFMSRKYDNIVKDRIRTIFHYFEGIYFAKYIQEDKSITHIHAHYASHPSTLSMVAASLNNITFSFTAHAYDIWEDRLFLTEKIKLAKFVITCTKYGKKYILDNNRILQPEKIIPIYHGVDTKMFKCENTKTFNIKIPNILCIGRLHEEKAQENLIMACKILKEEGFNFTCHIVGDGPSRNILEQMINKYNLSEIVNLEGKIFHEDIISYYDRATILVLPSIKENLPNVLLEGMAMGVPIIASNIAGIPELIKNEITGILMKPNDVLEIVNKIKYLCNNEILINKLSRNGKIFVKKYFDSYACIDKIINLYRINKII